MHRTLLAVTCLAALACAQAPTLPPGIAWQPDWDGALKLAAAQDKPLMVAFVLKGETANEQVMRGHFKDSKLIELSRHFVCVVACPGLKEKQKGVRFDGTTGDVSVDLGSVSPAEIARTERDARTRLLEASKVSCPQFVFVAPDGKTILLRHVWMLPKSELRQKMEMALAFHRPDGASDAVKEHRDRVLEFLVKAKDKDKAIRRPALTFLATLDDPRIGTFLVKRTQRDVPSAQRHEAIFTMGVRANAKVLARLHELLKARDLQTRVHAAVAIGKIGMADSISHLEKGLKREKQDRVRSHLLRALVATCEDAKILERNLASVMKRRAELDLVVALYLVSNLDATAALKKAVKALLTNSNKNVRTAAFVAVGSLMLSEYGKSLKRRLPGEKGMPKSACEWALSALGGPDYEAEEDPESYVYDLLPDNNLYEGDLEALVDENGRRRGGGRGGRSGGGRSGGRSGRRGR
ncbi:MAG: HEAT repeat domain-containing protein [Planctomycetota bacterium]|nr:HEAT repeat domain-containing protein [Planctomycetota bacterium]